MARQRGLKNQLLTLLLFAHGCIHQGESLSAPPPLATASIEAEKLLRKADSFFEGQDYENALKAYQDFLARFPRDPLAPLATIGAGKALRALGRYEEALSFAEEAKQSKDPVIAEQATILQGILCQQLGRHAEAVELLAPLASSRTNPEESRILLDALIEAALATHQITTAVVAIETRLGLSEGRELEVLQSRLIRLIEEEISPQEIETLYFALPHSSQAWRRVAERRIRLAAKSGDIARVRETGSEIRAAYKSKESNLLEFLDEAERLASPDPRVFGAILPLTGSASRPAQSAWQGLLFASGRPGRAPARPDAPIVLFRDDRGDPDRAAQAVEELTVRHRAIAIIGPMDFECVRKAGEVAARLRIPLVSLTQADPELPPNVFPLLPSIEEEVEVLLESAIAQGATRFALIHSGNFESEQARQAFEETLKRHRLYGNARSLLVSQALKSFESLLRTPPEAVLFAPQEPRHSQDLFLTFIHRAEKARAASRSRSQPGWTWLFPSAFEPAQEPLLHLPSIRLVFDIPQFRSMPGAEARRSTDPEIQKAFESQFHRPLQGPAAQAFDAFEILRALVDAGARTRPALFESLSALTKNDGPFPRALLRVRAARN